MYVQSKRTDEPPHDDQISSVYWFKRLTDRCDRVNNPQQSEGRPCRDEPRSQEADAGAFPQHEQVGGHQWAADEVRFFFLFISLSPEVKGRRVWQQAAAEVSDELFCALSSEGRTSQKVKRNKTESTTSLSCRRSTLAEATWRPSRAPSVWRRWVCWRSATFYFNFLIGGNACK